MPELRPTCCVLYGTIIGERPVLLKNFLGRRENKSKTVQLEEGEGKLLAHLMKQREQSEHSETSAEAKAIGPIV